MASSCACHRKNVSFNQKVRIRSVPSLDDLSKEEQQAAWFSSDDLNQIWSRERQLKNDEELLRDALRHEIGLESYDERKTRRNRIELGLYSVLAEQERQWDYGDDYNDPDTIAKALSAASLESMEVALKKATNVASEVNYDINGELLRCSGGGGGDVNKIGRGRRRKYFHNHHQSDEEFSKTLSANEKWHVTKTDTTEISNDDEAKEDTSIEHNTKKYDLRLLSGLVDVSSSSSPAFQ